MVKTEDINPERLYYGQLYVKPVHYSWYDNIDKWRVIYPYTHEDFEEYCEDSWEGSKECEEKLGYYSFEVMEQDIHPVMNYAYMLDEVYGMDSEDARKIEGTPLILVEFEDTEQNALVLAGGGMDFSWEICEAFIKLGYYPPIYFCDLPKMASIMSKRKEVIVKACLKSLEAVRIHLDRTKGNLDYYLTLNEGDRI
jgi:hypothetical protein